MKIASTATVVLLAAMPSMGGCQDHLKPQLNPNPQHIIRIVGRLPASLEIDLSASYAITNKDEACTPSVAQQWGAAGIGSYFRSEDLNIVRNGDRYETKFVVDRYLPGQCQWRFTKIGGGARRKDGDRKWAYASNPVITGLSFYDPGLENYCVSEDKRSECEIERNSRDIPVIVPCRMFMRTIKQPPPAPPPDGKQSLSCGGNTPVKDYLHKKTHQLVSSTGQVRIDFYDLDVEADPTEKSRHTGGVP